MLVDVFSLEDFKTRAYQALYVSLSESGEPLPQEVVVGSDAFSVYGGYLTLSSDDFLSPSSDRHCSCCLRRQRS